MPLPTPAIAIDDPALDGGDWLFQRDGQVYGPVEGRRLAELLYEGQIGPETQVSSGDGAWRPVSQVPLFLLHVKKAEAAQRVEQEVTGRRKLQARRERTKLAGWVVAAGLVVLAAVGVAFLVGRGRIERSPLLEDFGAGISIAVPARIAVAAPAGAGEVEVALDPAAPPAARRPRPVQPGAPAPGAPARAPGAVDGGDLVATEFDANAIQAVVGREQRTLAPCLRQEAERSPDLAGEVPLEFTVGNDGRVVRVAVMDPRLRAGPLRDCFEKVLRGDNWRFAPFPGQRPTIALVFKVGQ
jgi:hypothetical protein